MKMTITFEIEVSDIPERERLEIINDCGLDDEGMPLISEMSEDEVRAEVVEAFTAMFNTGDYEAQSEVWAGTNFYGYITNMTATSAPAPHLAVKDEIARVVQSVNDWDDRTSPDDYPDYLLITSEELADILRDFAAAIATSEGSDNVR